MGEERQVVLEGIPNIIASHRLSGTAPKHAYYREDIIARKRMKLTKRYGLSSMSDEYWLYMIEDSQGASKEEAAHLRTYKLCIVSLYYQDEKFHRIFWRRPR
jgi:hypothetical protein